jgi:hypothetical protein
MINDKLNKLMVGYIKSTGHNATGALAKSISFNARIDASGEFDLGFKANEYILYLDDGKFIDNFLSQSDVKDAIGDFVVEELTKGLFKA